MFHSQLSVSLTMFGIELAGYTLSMSKKFSWPVFSSFLFALAISLPCVSNLTSFFESAQCSSWVGSMPLVSRLNTTCESAQIGGWATGENDWSIRTEQWAACGPGCMLQKKRYSLYRFLERAKFSAKSIQNGTLYIAYQYNPLYHSRYKPIQQSVSLVSVAIQYKMLNYMLITMLLYRFWNRCSEVYRLYQGVVCCFKMQYSKIYWIPT